MKCVFCGTDNPDGALFCKKCGKRQDGMATCPSCGKDTPADGGFCIYCGPDLKAAAVGGAGLNKPAAERAERVKVEAYTAANIPEGAASAHGYGTADESAHEAAAADYAVGEGRTTAVAAAVKRALKVAAEAFAVLSALIGFIFVFFIGNDVSAGVSGVTAGLGGGYNIFYFFGDVYKNIESTLESSGLGSQNFVNYSYTAAAVVGTVCSALALAATVMLFIATVVRYVRKLLKHTQKSATGLAAATFFSYAFGVALFMMCVGGSAEMEGGNMVVTVNGATVAGLVLGGLFIVASAVSAVVCGINRSNAKQVALNGVTGTVAAVFAVIIAGVAANGMFGMTGNTGYGENLHAMLGITEFFNMLASYSLTYYHNNDDSGAKWEAFIDMFNAELVVNIVLLVFAVVFCILAVVSVSGIFSGFGKKIGARRVKSLVASGIFAVVAGIIMIVSEVLFLNWVKGYNGSTEYGAYVAVPVVVMLFGLLLIVCACIYTRFLRREEEEERYNGVQQPPRYDNGL